MSGTWAQYGSGSFDNAFDPDMNLDAWGYYMTVLLGMFGNDYARALTAYNGGPGHLTDPGRYGPPSSAAVAYGQALAAQSSYNVSAQPGAGNQPGLSSDNTGLFLALGIGLLVAFIALRD
jgi:soluble lytic murein transglycosylase-like protein